MSSTDTDELKAKPVDFQLTPVQSTSLLVAYWRDLETRQLVHKDRAPLIKDPTAQLLVDALLSPPQRKEYEASPIRLYGLECLAVRTRALDDWLSHGTSPKQRRQMVNLGAGLCCRPYRLGEESPHDTWWEVDSDLELLSVKRAVLEAAGYFPKLPVVDVSVDLACTNTSLAAALKAKGFSGSNMPTDWIAEGLLPYLEPSQHTKIFQETAAISMVGSRMAVTVLEQAMSELWKKHGVQLPYEDLVPVEQILDKAKSFGWVVAEHIRPEDWSRLYPGRGEYLPGYHLLFLTKGES